jgi:beta-phosphoglucomutase
VRLPSAIVFDFDGVLADSEPLHFRMLQRVLAEAGVALSEEDYYERFLGYNDEDALSAIGVAVGRPFTPAEIVELAARKTALVPTLLREPGVLFPSTRPCLERLEGRVPLAIASGAKRHEIEAVLDANGLARFFPVLVASGETPRSKPAPDPYARAIVLLQQQGLVPGGRDVARRAVAIEDSRWGLESARGAGLRTIAVTTSYTADELSIADLVIGDLADLTDDRLAVLVEDA